MAKFKPFKDGGSLRHTETKKSPSAPEYWGEIAVDLENKENIRFEDGLTIVKLSGWKKKDSKGNTYLSLGVDRYVRKQIVNSKQDDDVPF